MRSGIVEDPIGAFSGDGELKQLTFVTDSLHEVFDVRSGQTAESLKAESCVLWDAIRSTRSAFVTRATRCLVPG